VSRFAAALTAGLALLLVACDTEPPANVGYFDATVRAKVGCVDTRGDFPGYDAEWRIAYRQPSASSWTGDSWHAYSCPDEQVPQYLPGSPFSEQLTGLEENSQYQYRLEIRLQGQSGIHSWYDSQGTENGTSYDSFTTLTFPTVAPRAAKALRDNIGINTRMAYQGTPYANCGENIEAMQYMGIRFLRDGFHPSWDLSWNCWRFIVLGGVNIKGTFGISDLKFAGRLTHCDPPDPAGPRPATAQEIQQDTCPDWDTTDDKHDGGLWAIRVFDPNKGQPDNCLNCVVEDLKANDLGPIIDQWGSINEPDLYTPFRNWPQVMRDYQQWLYGLKSDPELGGRPVLGPSFVSAQAPQQVGNISHLLDMGDMHPYPAGVHPGENFDLNLPKCAQTAGTKPCRTTEVGYHTDLAVTGGHKGVSHAVNANYSLRLVLEAFRRGLPRIDFFAIVDQWCNSRSPNQTEDKAEPTAGDWGFYDCNWNPYPVAHAMHYFTQTVGDGTPALTALRYRRTQTPGNFQQVLTRRADGAYVLAVWRNVSIWNRDTSQPVSVAAETFAAQLPDAQSVHLVRPLQSAQEQPASFSNGQLTYQLAGEPVLFVIR
jgi:hypothetical protein